MPLSKTVLQHRRSVLFGIWEQEYHDRLRVHRAQEKIMEDRRKNEVEVLIASDEFSFLAQAASSLRPG